VNVKRFTFRVVCATIIAALVWSIVSERSSFIYRFIEDVAFLCGQSSSYGSRGLTVFTSGGGHFRSGPGSEIWNWPYDSVPDLVHHCATIAGASVTLLLTSGVPRSRRLKSRGPTKCGSCQYDLAGLTHPQCPESGQSIDQA
jgi:hypothetical protein